MKKYYLKDTGEEVNFGDMIELDFVSKDGTEHEHVELKFIPQIVDMLLEEGTIVEKKVKKEPEFKGIRFEFCKPNEKSDLEKYVEELESRIIELEGIVAELRKK